MNLKKHVKEVIAYSVAKNWLKWAEDVIKRGESPAKLSVCGHDMVRDTLSLLYPEITGVSHATLNGVKKLAIIEALNILRTTDNYRAVRIHFSGK